jgi:hypothetical protein
MDLHEEIVGESRRIDDDEGVTQFVGTPVAQTSHEIIENGPEKPTIPLDIGMRIVAAAIDSINRHERAPLDVLERVAAEMLIEAPEEHREAAVRLLRASLQLSGADDEIAVRAALHADVPVNWP